MIRTSWVELCVSDLEQSIAWFERVLDFHVIAREANEYAELARGETVIQLAAEDSVYWSSAPSQLLPVGQRGSGAEIILLVERIDALYEQAQLAQAEITRPLADYPWHMRQFWVRHPDGYLLRPAQRLLSVKPATYRRQIADAFEYEEENRVAHELSIIKQTSDRLLQQHNYLDAATLYETLVMEIFERSHLYKEDDIYYQDFSEEPYYPEEEGLDELVNECIEGLGHCLANNQADHVARQKSIDALFAILQYDLSAEYGLNFAAFCTEQLVDYTVPLERRALATRIREILTNEEQDLGDTRSQAYGRLLLDLERDTLDDDAYLSTCRLTKRTTDLVDRLLKLGRIDEAVQETRQITDYDAFFRLISLFLQHGQDTVAEHLVRERNEEQPGIRLLNWLQEYYQTRDRHEEELAISIAIFREQPWLRHYQELRELAQSLHRWDSLRLELLTFLEQEQNISLLTSIALDEEDIDDALLRLKTMAKKDMYGYTYNGSGSNPYNNIALQVARAAEKTHTPEAIELYQQYAERLIKQRGRNNYQEACKYLARIQELYVRLDEQVNWTQYITTLREQNHTLRALAEELRRAGL